MFADRYVRSVNASNLKDDELHHNTDALAASAVADLKGCGLGAMLCRVKYADGIVHKDFESGSHNMAQLLKTWVDLVERRAKQRHWMKTPRTAWDAQAAFGLYRAVAHKSLAYWLDGSCECCRGSGVNPDESKCKPCDGSGKQEIKGSSHFETERIKDMVSELQGILDSYGARAAKEMRG